MENQKTPLKMFPLLQVTDVCCGKSPKMVLDHINLALNSGESLGILGLRQSGQSLLLQVLAGAIRPNSGKVQLAGYTPKQGKKFYSQVGIVTESPSLFGDLRIEENLDFIACLKGCSKNPEIDGILERLDLKPHLKERLNTDSPGLYRRTALACALLGQPALLLMDDILYGIDPLSLELIQNEVQRFMDQGGTLIWVVHTPADLETMQHTAWMDDGKLEILPKEEVTARWHTPAFHLTAAKAGE